MLCPNCSLQNNSESRFCSKCGAPLPKEEAMFTQSEMQNRIEAERSYINQQIQMHRKVQNAKKWATAALIMAVTCFLFFYFPNFFGILGVIFAIIALAKMPKYGSKTYPAVALVLAVLAFMLNITFFSALVSGIKNIDTDGSYSEKAEDFFNNREGGGGIQLSLQSGGEVYNLDF